METIKKKMASLRVSLQEAEERADKSEAELKEANDRATNVSIVNELRGTTCMPHCVSLSGGPNFTACFWKYDQLESVSFKLKAVSVPGLKIYPEFFSLLYFAAIFINFIFRLLATGPELTYFHSFVSWMCKPGCKNYESSWLI